MSDRASRWTIEYIKSERWIHDDLLQQAALAVEAARSSWRETGRIDPFMVAWPEDDVYSIEGELLDFVHFALPSNAAQAKKERADFVEQTKPYALLLCHVVGEEVRIIFESQHGTQSWTLPIEQRGTQQVLGEAHEDTDRLFIGVLWQPQDRGADSSS